MRYTNDHKIDQQSAILVMSMTVLMLVTTNKLVQNI